jgi:hypothetical protein
MKNPKEVQKVRITIEEAQPVQEALKVGCDVFSQETKKCGTSTYPEG